MATPVGALEDALLLPGCVPFYDDNKSEVWKGPIKTAGGQTIAFVKMPPANQLLSEAACALVGRALGLNIPKPYLVLVNKSELPKALIWTQTKESHRLGFGLEDGKHPSLRRWFNNQWSADKVRFLSVISSWPSCREVALFDEWIANIDRHMGNLLFDGSSNFVLVDHGHAFTRRDWDAAALRDPSISVQNRLLHERSAALSLFERYQWRNAANDEAHRYRDLDVDGLLLGARMLQYASQADADAACTFLRARINEMVSLTCKKLGIGVL